MKITKPIYVRKDSKLYINTLTLPTKRCKYDTLCRKKVVSNTQYCKFHMDLRNELLLHEDKKIFYSTETDPNLDFPCDVLIKIFLINLPSFDIFNKSVHDYMIWSHLKEKDYQEIFRYIFRFKSLTKSFFTKFEQQKVIKNIYISYALYRKPDLRVSIITKLIDEPLKTTQQCKDYTMIQIEKIKHKEWEKDYIAYFKGKMIK